jgi:hypothetical protein
MSMSRRRAERAPLDRVVMAVTRALGAVALPCLLAACGSESPAAPVVDPTPTPTPPPPPVVQRLPRSAVTVPSGLYAFCLGEQDERAYPSDCPFVRWRGRSYWAHAYTDNRLSMAITAYDSAGTVLGVREVTGARYLKAIAVVTSDSTLVLRGQSDQTVTIRWAELP